MKQYLKLFLAMAIPYAIFMSIFLSLFTGIFKAIVLGSISGILYGGIVTSFLYFLNNWQLKKIESKTHEKVRGVRHSKEIEVSLPYDKAFDLCIESLKLIKRCNVEKEDRSKGEIVAKTGVSWKSWGELITFKIEKNGEKVKIKVKSEPVLKTTLIDYGKNFENVEKITSFLEKHSE